MIIPGRECRQSAKMIPYFFKDGDSHSYKAGHMVIPMELICGSSPASPSPPLGTPEQRMCFVSTSKFI